MATKHPRGKICNFTCHQTYLNPKTYPSTLKTESKKIFKKIIILKLFVSY